MLVVERKAGESITTGEAVQVKVLKIGWSKVRLAVLPTAELAGGQEATDRGLPGR